MFFVATKTEKRHHNCDKRIKQEMGFSMNILITGAKGFIGKNLIARLKEYGDKYNIYSFDIDSTMEQLDSYAKDCDFVFNFAAVHRPKEVSEFEQVNYVFFDDLLKLLEKYDNRCPVLYTSSIQATNGTPYGESKLLAEAELVKYGEKTGARTLIYRLTNTYGRWAMPNHHSVVATFCYNIINGIELQISDPNIVMHFYYVDDVIDSFVSQLEGESKPDADGIFRLPDDQIHTITLGGLAETLLKFKGAVDNGVTPEFADKTEETLYYTFLSYLN